jgi:hypothetical protein
MNYIEDEHTSGVDRVADTSRTDKIMVVTAKSATMNLLFKQ